jgi:hypothetical protein
MKGVLMSYYSLKADLEQISEHFLHFAEYQAAPDNSPLYAFLARHIAADAELLTLAQSAPPDQPTANIFLAAVHYLLLSGIEHPLSAFYPTLTSTPGSVTTVYPTFHAFCLMYAERIREIMHTRFVQTNEVSRCACMLPAFEIIYQLGQGRPMAIIEVGTSAGVNLLWDHYSYNYGDTRTYGLQPSALQLNCKLRGERQPPFPQNMPVVSLRIGLDLHPININNTDAMLWLRALIWPEHVERVARLQSALEVVRQQRPLIMSGDALKLLPMIMANVPFDMTLCIFHSFTLDQFSPEARKRFAAILIEASKHREIFRVSYEVLTPLAKDPLLDLFLYVQGTEMRQLVAKASAHGNWLEWVA